MNLYFHLSPSLRTNTYLVGPEAGGDALLIDPGEMDVPLLRIIEGNGYYIRAILVTQPHPGQVHGVKTILKIYEAQLYGNAENIYDSPCVHLADGEHLRVCGCTVETMNLTEDSQGPLVYRIENLLFTGLLATAGNMIRGPNRSKRESIAEQVDLRLLTLPDDVLFLPGAGPPSSVRAERLLRQFSNKPPEPLG